MAAGGGPFSSGSPVPSMPMGLGMGLNPGMGMGLNPGMGMGLNPGMAMGLNPGMGMGMGMGMNTGMGMGAPVGFSPHEALMGMFGMGGMGAMYGRPGMQHMGPSAAGSTVMPLGVMTAPLPGGHLSAPHGG